MSLTTRDEQAPPDPDIPPAVPAVRVAAGVPAVGLAAGGRRAAGGEAAVSPVPPVPAVPGLVVLAADGAPMCSDGVCL